MARHDDRGGGQNKSDVVNAGADEVADRNIAFTTEGGDASPGFPRAAASIPTASSGMLVPIATTVNPLVIGETLSRPAKLAALRTRISAPKTKATSPKTS